MRSPTYALIWEQWRQVRLIVTVSVLVTAIVALTPEWLFEQIEADFKIDVLLTCGLIGMLFVSCALLFDRTPSGISFAVSRRLFALPVARWKTALSLHLFRVAVFTLCGLGLLVILGEVVDTSTNVLFVTTVLACLFSIVNAIAWSAGRESTARGIAVLLIAPIPVLYFLTHGSLRLYARTYWWLYEADSAVWGQSDRLHLPTALLYWSPALVVLMVSSMIAIRSVHPRRQRGVFRGFAKRKSKGLIDFNSQLGFELRHSFGWYPAMCAAIALLVMIVLVLDPDRIHAGDLIEEAGPPILLIGGIATGLFILLYDQRYSATGTMLFTRPVSTGTLASSRFRTSAISVITTAGFWLLLYQATSPLERGDMYGDIGRLTLTISIAAVTIMWVPLQAILLGAWLALSTSMLTVLSQNNSAPPLSMMILLYIVLPSFIFVGRAYYVMRELLRRQLLRGDLMSTAMFTLIAALLLTLFWTQRMGVPPDLGRWGVSAYLAGLCILTTVPAYALACHTLWLDRIRHGQPLHAFQLPASIVKEVN